MLGHDPGVLLCSICQLREFLMKPSDDQFKVGLFGIGLDAYWPQFPELRVKLVAFIEQVARRLEGFKVQVTESRSHRFSGEIVLDWTRVP